MKKTNALFSSAFSLAVKGYSVMPVGPDKKPLLKTWRPYQTKAAQEEEITDWWNEHPQANVGIITGKISGITVIDIDTHKGGGVSLDAFPRTYTVKTGNGGYHLYYKYEAGLSISANAYPQFPNVDIRSDGGYVIAPPSVTKYNGKGGAYKVERDIPLAPFPAKLFGAKRAKRTMSTLTGVCAGGRNDSIASFIGKLLRAEEEKEWGKSVWPAVQRANATYHPPLPANELKTTFDSIVTKEKARRAALIASPIRVEDLDEDIFIPVRKNGAGVPYKDVVNALSVLQHHPYYKGAIRYNIFRQEIEFDGKPLEEGDLLKTQVFMQRSAHLPTISKDTVYSAISHYANENQYDEAQEWVKSLKWDGKKRLISWLHSATGVANDKYHQGIGSQWFLGMIRRIMHPGCAFDYVLVMVGAQGIGKTSLFRILGGPWYKSYTGAIDNKDFYLALRGAMIVDLDEGAALYRSEAIKIKSIITDTHDEYRAPYDRVMKKYPRRFVFSMSTNDTEPFRDITGNRRYWTVDSDKQVDFKWLEENREQLFAEAYDAYINKTKLPEVPLEEAMAHQEAHLPEDSWTDMVMKQMQKSIEYCAGSIEYNTTVGDVFHSIFPEESMARLDKGKEMRIANIFKKYVGLEKRRMMIGTERATRWVLTPKRAKELQKENAKDTRDDFDKYDPKAKF